MCNPGTGIFQPADVGLQRIIKHFMRQETLNYLVRQHDEHVKAGLTPESVKFATSIKPLRLASLGAIERCQDWLTSGDGKTIVARAWDKCTVTGRQISLSAQWFTNPLSVPQLISYLQTHPALYEEIKSKIGSVPGVDDEPVNEEGDDFAPNDDSDVPIRAVVRETLGLDLASCDAVNSAFCVDSNAVQIDEHGDLQAASPSEHVFDSLECLDSDSDESTDENTT
jgi:hypothetical protein